MCDEIPAPPTTNDPTDEPNAGREPAPSRRERDAEPDDERGGSAGVDPDDPRDGVDPPEETGSGRGERDRNESDRPEPDRDETDETGDSEPVEYRIERLRLVRIVVTLAVVVARLIRSL
jgi:hypothetical protein